MKVSWPKIRDELTDAHAPLAASLRKLGAGVKENLFEAWYPYGSVIVEDGQFLPPCGAGDGACSACNELRRKVQSGYGNATRAVPLTLVLSECVEVFTTVSGNEEIKKRESGRGPRRVPLRVLSRGEIFGAYETTDLLLNTGRSKSPWSVSAGARSLFLLTRLTGSQNALEGLREILGERVAPAKYCEDWELIRYVAKSQNLEWGVRVLIIANPRGDGRRDRQFRETVFETAWHQSRNAREAIFYELRRHEKPHQVIRVDPLYCASTLRHLVAIANGDVPGFAPVRADELQAGPFTEIQEFLLKSRLCGAPYFPAILQPAHFATDATQSARQHRVDLIYYSLSRPTVIGRVHEKGSLAEFAGQLEHALPNLLPHGSAIEIRCVRPTVREKKQTVYKWALADASLLAADFGVRSRTDEYKDVDLSQGFFQACIRLARR